MGRALSNNLINAQIKDAVKEVLKDMNIDFDMIEDEDEKKTLNLMMQKE